MDIRLVLNNLRPHVDCGPMSGTGKTYKQLKDHWPKDSGPCPTEAKMNVEWKKIQDAKKARKTDDQIKASMDALLAGVPDANTKKILKGLMLAVFERDEKSLKRHGVNIER